MPLACTFRLRLGVSPIIPFLLRKFMKVHERKDHSGSIIVTDDGYELSPSQICYAINNAFKMMAEMERLIEVKSKRIELLNELVESHKKAALLQKSILS
jgi:hypothetical protein